MHILPHRTCHRKSSPVGCARCGAAGLIAGTRLRTAHGWHAVEKLDRATELCTMPSGTARPTGVKGERIWLDPVDCPLVVRPLRVPPGALGNEAAFLLQQDMRLVFHDPEASRILGADAITIRAGDLKGFAGIKEATPPRRKELVMLDFAQPVVLEVAGGARILCEPALRDPGALIDGTPELERAGSLLLRHLDAAQADAYLASLDCKQTVPA